MGCTPGNAWRNFLARKKLCGIAGLAYVLLMIAAYNSRFWSFLNREGSLKLSFGRFLPYDLSKIFANRSHYDANNVASVSRILESMDIHLEDDKFGHTGEIEEKFHNNVQDLNSHRQENYATKIAVGGAVTSKGAGEVSEQNIGTALQIFTTFLPSFCSTVSTKYSFQFYFAYDKYDPVFSSTACMQEFHKNFRSIVDQRCPKDLEVGLHFVQCGHSGKPTWAQNDAMLEAYLDDVDYFYRVNDDTRLDTKGWVEEFLKTLKNYDPPNVGVVGPNHSGGNTAILTYDFVHKTHVDIFGFYYPKLFTDWWGDDWVTGVYKPERSTKLKHVRLAHTMSLGQRYHTDHSVGAKLQARLDLDRKTLTRYLERIKLNSTVPKIAGKKFISMTLYGKDPKYTWGAIRNAQLMPIVFPQWTLRLYIPHPEFFPPNATNGTTSVPSRIVSKLRQLGAQILFVKAPSVPPKYWSYLITIDPEVDYFLIRNVESRISDRDAAAVSDWLERRDAEAVHCVRDHPKHANVPIVDGLWGGSTAKINKILKGKRLFEVVAEYFTNSSFTVADYERGNQSDHKTTTEHLRNLDMLKDILWPIMSDYVLCHDSVSCDKWNNTLGFPVKREAGEFLGEKFDERQTSISDGFEEIKSSNPLCNGIGFYHLQESNSTQM